MQPSHTYLAKKQTGNHWITRWVKSKRTTHHIERTLREARVPEVSEDGLYCCVYKLCFLTSNWLMPFTGLLRSAMHGWTHVSKLESSMFTWPMFSNLKNQFLSHYIANFIVPQRALPLSDISGNDRWNRHCKFLAVTRNWRMWHSDKNLPTRFWQTFHVQFPCTLSTNHTKIHKEPEKPGFGSLSRFIITHFICDPTQSRYEWDNDLQQIRFANFDNT